MRICLGLMLLLMLCGPGVCAESQQVMKPEIITRTPQQSARTEQRGSEKSPLFVKITPPEVTKEESAAIAKEKEEKKSVDNRLVLYTACLAIIGTLQLIVFALQARRLRQTIEVTKDSVDALKASERPYIFVEVSHTFLAVNNDRQTAICNYTISNLGKTPSIITFADMKIMVAGETNFSLSADGQINAKKVLAAGESIKPGRTKDLSVETQNGKLFCYGLIRYQDIFGAEHITEFHHIYVSSIEGFCVSDDKERNRYT